MISGKSGTADSTQKARQVRSKRFAQIAALLHKEKRKVEPSQGGSPKLQYRRLFREFFGLFCGPSHPFFGRRDLRLSDLAGQASVSFITDQLTDALRPVTLMRAQAQLDDRVVGTSPNLEEVRRMIVAGLGIGPLPIDVVQEDIEMGRLWRLPPVDNPPAIDVHVVWNSKARHNRAEAYLLKGLLDRIEATPIEARTYPPRAVEIDSP